MTTPAAIAPGALPEKAEPYRVSFSITGPGGAGRELLDRVEAHIREWLAGRSQEPEVDQPSGSWSDDDYEISIDRDSLGDAGYVSFKWECEDRRAPGFWLRLDVDLATEGGPVSVSAESYFLERDDAEPPDLLAGPPPLVHGLLAAFHCYMGEERLSGEVSPVSPEAAGEFAAGRILSPERQLPVVAVSQGGRGKPAIDPARLQRILAGAATVATYGDAAAQALRERLGWQLACYDGAVRVYWPGCAPGDRSGQHKVWMGREAAKLGFRLILQLQGECLRRLAPAFDRRMFEAVKGRIEQEKLRVRLLELEAENRRWQEEQESRESGAGTEARIRELEAANAELKRQLRAKNQENKQLAASALQQKPQQQSGPETALTAELRQTIADRDSQLAEKDAEIQSLETEHNLLQRRQERESERLRQVFTGSEWVGTGLRVLKSGLRPFVFQEFTGCYGDRTLTELYDVFNGDIHAPDDLRKAGTAEQAFQEMASAALLKVMFRRWGEVFIKKLRPTERDLVRDLQGYRNDWAHQRTFHGEKAANALEAMHRLLAAINSPQAKAAERLRIEHHKAAPVSEPANRRRAA